MFTHLAAFSTMWFDCRPFHLTDRPIKGQVQCKMPFALYMLAGRSLQIKKSKYSDYVTFFVDSNGETVRSQKTTGGWKAKGGFSLGRVQLKDSELWDLKIQRLLA